LMIWAEKSLAVASSRMTVQSITISCCLTPDHSTKLTAILPSAPERIASASKQYPLKILKLHHQEYQHDDEQDRDDCDDRRLAARTVFDNATDLDAVAFR